MKKFLSLAVWLLILFTNWIHSQQQQFRLFGISQGLCHDFVNTIFQDQNGFLWAGTGNGLCRFDGWRFAVNPTKDSLPSDFVTTSYKDSNGNIWLGHNEGSLSLFNGKNFIIVSPAAQTGSKIVGIIEDPSGKIFAATQRSGIILVSSELIPEYHREEFTDLTISSISQLNQRVFLIGTFDGLYQFEFIDGKFGGSKKINIVPAANIQAIKFDESFGIVYLGTQDAGLVVLKAKVGQLELLSTSYPEKLSKLNVQDILLEENGKSWLSTFGEGIIQLEYHSEKSKFEILTHYKASDGLPEDNIKQVIRDFEGNLWVGSFSEGLAYLVDGAFSVFPDFGEKFGTNVLSITSANDIFYLGSANGIISFSQNNPKKLKFWGINEGLPKDGITALAADNEGNLYIGTASKGIFIKPSNSDKIRSFYFAQNSSANIIHSLKLDGNTLWAGTNAGAFSFSLPGNNPKIFDTTHGLPHNSVRNIIIDAQKKVWVATKGNRIFSITDQKHIQVADIELDFSTIVADKKGRMWAATMGHGVILLKNDTLLQFTSDEGLLNNFCYSLAFDNEGHAWVGHRLGLSRINEDNYKIRAYGNEIGIAGDCNYNALLNTPSGDLLIGTTRGLLIYHASRAREIPPPKSNITAVYISDLLVDHTRPIKLPYGSYKLRIEFAGISFSNPEKVTYRYKLDGHDLDWSTISTESYALYPRIDDGDFKFLLTSYNADGIATQEPLELKIMVNKPLRKQAWFLGLMFILAIMGVILIIKIREKAQILKAKHLEEELGKRTKELKEKNSELEKKNRDITDSINYAKRIQGSILPPIHKLEMDFPGSFVFYRPRDIVSGDFYWFDKVSNSKFLIVCADSTGHGVPGALMSMIGTTLIKDISMRMTVQSPSDVLSMLDNEIASMLNVQTSPDGEKSTDGMDLTVCEIDLKTNYLRFASAMRPIMLYHKNELLYLRGSRNAIGGYLAENKEFENQGYQLNKGDILYMFTDGYPDQFGGPYGKKYKIVRLKNLLADICSMPVEKQKLMILNEFDNWKGDQDQVDDVLFMCIKI